MGDPWPFPKPFSNSNQWRPLSAGVGLFTRTNARQSAKSFEGTKGRTQRSLLVCVCVCVCVYVLCSRAEYIRINYPTVIIAIDDGKRAVCVSLNATDADVNTKRCPDGWKALVYWECVCLDFSFRKILKSIRFWRDFLNKSKLIFIC